MPALRPRPTIETLLAIALAAAIVVNAGYTSSITTLVRWSGDVRWGLLALVAVLAAVAIARRRERPLLTPTVLAATALAALGAGSTAWSVGPRETISRVIAFAVMLAAASGVAATLGSTLRGRRAAVTSVFAAGAVVVLAGLVMLALDHSEAFQAANVAEGISYYRGVSQNPNTVALLATLVVPLGIGLYSTSAGLWRWTVAAIVVVSAASIAASGARGAVVAAAAAAIVTSRANALGRRDRRLVIGLVVLLLLTGLVLQGLRNPDAAHAAVAGRPDIGALSTELGRPGAADASWVTRSARVHAWAEGVRQGAERPSLGHGFGMEGAVFIDRIYGFQGRFTENSYVGAFLELGVVGLGLLAVTFGLSIAGATRARESDPYAIPLAGAVVGAALLAFTQSYLLAAGNIATVAAWTCVCLAAATATAVTRRRVLRLLGALALALALAVPLGRLERVRSANEQQRGIEEVWSIVPHALDARGLSAYRLAAGFSCLLYPRDSNPYALEVCFELNFAGSDGKLIEAVDRRDPSRPRFWSMRPDPASARISVDPQRLEALLVRLGAAEFANKHAGGWPVLWVETAPIPVTG